MDIKLAAFDMDGTLTQGRVVFALADMFELSDRAKEIQSGGEEGHLQTKAIAALFAGISRKDLENAVESIPLTKNCERAISLLKEGGCRIGVVSDSYTVAAGIIASRLALDFVAANELQIVDGRITGRVDMPLGWEKIGCFCRISVCKRYHLEKQARNYGIPISNTMAVGDTKSDVCMIKRAGVGIAFMPKDDAISSSTANIVREPDLMRVLDFAK